MIVYALVKNRKLSQYVTTAQIYTTREAAEAFIEKNPRLNYDILEVDIPEVDDVT